MDDNFRSDYSGRLHHIKQIEKMCQTFKKYSDLPEISTAKNRSKRLKFEKPDLVSYTKLKRVIRGLRHSLDSSPNMMTEYPLPNRGPLYNDSQSNLGPGAYSLGMQDSSSFLISDLPRLQGKVDHLVRSLRTRDSNNVKNSDLQYFSKKSESKRKSPQNRLTSHKESRQIIEQNKQMVYQMNIEVKNNRLRMFKNRHLVLNAQSSWSKLICAIGYAFLVYSSYTKNRSSKIHTNNKYKVLVRNIRCIGRIMINLKRIRSLNARKYLKSISNAFSMLLVKRAKEKELMISSFSLIYNQKPFLSKGLYTWKTRILKIQCNWKSFLVVRKYRKIALDIAWNRILHEKEIEKRVNRASRGRSESISLQSIGIMHRIPAKIQTHYINLYIQSKIKEYLKRKSKYNAYLKQDIRYSYKYIRPALRIFSRNQMLVEFAEKAKISFIRKTKKFSIPNNL